MAGKLTRLQLTYKIEDAAGIAMYTGVTYGDNEGGCKKPTADGQYPLGVVDNDERLDIPYQASGNQSGRDVAVKVELIADVKLSGAVSYGDEVILATGGSVKKLPSTASTKEKATISVTAPVGAAGAGNVTVSINGTDYTVAVANDDAATVVADKIAEELKFLAGYKVTVAGAVVTIEALASGVQVDTAYDAGTTGATATVAVAVQGGAGTAGSYWVLGRAEKAGVDGDIIPVRIEKRLAVVA